MQVVAVTLKKKEKEACVRCVKVENQIHKLLE